MPANFILIFLLFVLHTVCMSFLCPSRFSIKTTAQIWSGVILSSALAAFGLMKTFSLNAGAYITMSITIVPYVAVIFYLSRHPVSKTLFIFLTYLESFWVVLFLSGLLSSLFFCGEWIAAAVIRTALHIGVVFLCAALSRPFASMSQRIIKGWWPLNLVAALFAAYLGYLAPRSYAKVISTFALVSFALLLTIIVTVHVVFLYTIRYMDEGARRKQAELQSTLLLQQIESMQETVEAAKRSRHDIRHHNLLIVQYAKKRQIDELLQYLGEYEKKRDSHAEPAYCENIAANNILTAYIQKAKKHGIEVRLDITLEQNIAIHDIDLVVILANLMENSIHGCICSEKPQPFIELYIGRKASKLVIYAKNTAGEDLIFDDGLPISVKGENIGVSSILHSAAGYGGEYDFRLQDGVFSCQLLLKTSKTVVSKTTVK